MSMAAIVPVGQGFFTHGQGRTLKSQTREMSQEPSPACTGTDRERPASPCGDDGERAAAGLLPVFWRRGRWSGMVVRGSLLAGAALPQLERVGMVVRGSLPSA